MTVGASLAPLRVSLPQSMAEAAGLYAAANLAGMAANGFGRQAGGLFSTAAVGLGWLWLCVWPAWRLRLIHESRRRGVVRGAGRALLVVLMLGGAVVAFSLVMQQVGAFWPANGVRGSRLPVIFLIIAFGFGLTRVAVLTGAWMVGRARRRLRWRLMVSYVLVILCTFGALTGLGSVIGISLVLRAVQPNAVEMARSLREQLLLTGRPLDRGIAQRLFQDVATARVPLRGEPFLAPIVGHAEAAQGLALLTPAGKVLAAEQAPAHALTARRWTDLPNLTPADWSTLRSAALDGRTAHVSYHLPGSTTAAQAVLAAVPITNARGTTTGILLLAAAGPKLTAGRFLQAVIVAFGATTIALTIVAAIPLLAISFLASYLVARGLTRRLEPVARVATAVAAGNFTERALVTSVDEVGHLANDVNRMAAQLEQLVIDLTRARSQAEEALSTRQQLVANVSHELRTPLAVLSAHLESIPPSDGISGTPVPAETIGALRGETGRLAAMIDDLFALSRAETGALQLDCRPLDVGAAVAEVAAFMGPLAQREGAITLTTDVEPDLPPAAADPGRLHQILANLVRNAVRHTAEGGIVALSARRDGAFVAIAVADTGTGIAPEDVSHVFERFYRADPSRARETGGAGLGLSIVRELVELMGGRAEVESTPGVGSRFTIVLPIASS